MEKKQYAVRFGIYSFLGIAAFFLLMKLCGWEDVGELRLLNLLIVVFMTNRLARVNYEKNKQMEYFQELGSLVIANAITVALSIIGFVAYVKLIDPEFLTHFQGGVLWTRELTLQQSIIVLLFEGMAAAVIVSFGVMQFWKDQKKRQLNKEISVESHHQTDKGY